MSHGCQVEITDVEKRFSTHAGEAIQAIETVSLTVGRGEFVALVGPSGCGKSTLLNCVAGLDRPDRGAILIDGAAIGNGPTPGAGYMFQQDTLLPWYTVEHNVGLGLRYARVHDTPEARQRVDHLLDVTDLAAVRRAYPAELSGGMRRRAALCAALAIQPRLLLMDEPFSALDTFTKASIQQYLLDLWAELRPTVLFVTHDLEEAVTLADRVVVFSRRPARILDVVEVPIPRPRNVFSIKESADFVACYQRTWHALGREFGTHAR